MSGEAVAHPCAPLDGRDEQLVDLEAVAEQLEKAELLLLDMEVSRGDLDRERVGRLVQALGQRLGHEVQDVVQTLGALQPDARYTLVAEGGLRLAHADDRASLSGAQWADLQATVALDAPFTATLRACAEMSAELKPQLRALLHYHCGVKVLKTRQMMIDLQSL